MSNKNKRVLIVASLEISREASLIFSKRLTESGYSPVLCHRGGDDINISEDRILEGKMTLTDIAGVVFLDDGGDEAAAIELIQNADKKDITIGLFQAGCIVGKKSKIFKDRFLCSGLPKEYYKGADQTNAHCVRSGNLVTSSGECLEGFIGLVIGALGGKQKNIIISGPTTPEVVEACDNGTIVKNLSSLFDMGKEITDGDLEEIIKAKSRHTVIFPRETKKILGRGNFAILVGSNVHKIIQKEELYNLLKGARLSSCGLVVDGLETEISVLMEKTTEGWRASFKQALLNGRIHSLKSLPVDLESFAEKCEEMAHQACLLVEASLDRPECFNHLQTYFSSQDDNPKLVRVSSVPMTLLEESETGLSPEKKEVFLKKKILEREMAFEGIFIQPDGEIGLDLAGELKKLDPYGAVDLLAKLAKRVNDDVKRKTRISRSRNENVELARLQNVSSILRHKIRLLLTYMQTSKLLKQAEVDIDGVNGWYSNLDLPMQERVFPYAQDEQDFTNDDKWIKGQPRYNPEYYEMGDSKSTSGFYYTWWEIANSPYYWSRILEDGIYPMTMQYKGIGGGAR